MIKVTNIPSGTSEDSLLFFFENRRKSGGGSIIDIEYDQDTQSAVITFEDPEAVKRVLGKMPILFSGVQIGVEEFRPSLEVESADQEEVMESENILEVRGVSDRTSLDTVEMYFENTRRSGGGDIKNIEEKEGVFYIVFEDESVIENVLRKRHKIDGTAIEVCRYVPPPPPKPVPMYSNKVFIKNISEKTTKDGLENFLEAKTGITPTSIEYGELEGAALVTFEEDLDFEKLQLACKKRSLDKSYLEVSRVPITNCVIVRNVSEKTSRDTLEFYFDNERRSGVTGVLDVRQFDGFCLVYFEEPEAVDLVCRRQHKVDGQVLDVKIYYECLGQVESEEEGPFQPPGPLELTDLDTKKLQFLIKSPSNQQAIDKQLEAVYGKPVWPKKSKSVSLTVDCTLTAETKDCKKLAKTWEAKVKENLNKFLDLLLVTKHSTLQEAFPLVLNELKSLTISNPDAVAVVLEKSNHEIYVTGHIQASQEVSRQVSDIIQKVEQELDRKKQQVQEEKRIKRHQVLILQFCKFEQNLQKKYEGISLKYDVGKNCVYFEGLSGEVTPAIVEMYEFLSKVVKTDVKPFSRFLRSFLVTQPVCKYVNSRMKENDLIGVWEPSEGDDTLTVYSLSDQQAVKAAHLLKESVIETPVDVKDESRPLLSQEEWRSRATEIEKEGEGLIKIITQIDQSRILILCTDKFEGTSREYVDNFMIENTIYEETLQLDTGMMRYIQMNCAQAIDKVDKDVQKDKGNVKISNIGIMIKGTKTGLNKAKYAVDQIVQGVKKQVHPIKKPGIRKHLESTQGQDKIRSVEKTQGVVIDVSDESLSDEDTDSTVLRTGVPRQELAVCVTPLGKKISAMVVDMLELEVDVIVNPANKDMRHIGGLAKIIVEKGGRSIQEECNDYVRKKGRLMEGQVFLSSAGNLKCKGVVHAVGPVWQNGTNQEEEYLREAVFKSLEATSENRFTSIAFPALCTGVFGYPMREATRVIVVAVRDFFSENSSSPVEAVYLCDVSQDTVEGFVRAMKKELKDVKVKSPESRSSGSSSKWKTSSGPVPAERKSFKPSPVEAGNITVRVITGQIAKQTVDVIVNTTSKDLKLGNGAVSASLLKAAGPGIQQECDQNYPGGIQHGNIAVTSGGNLSCQFICHGSLPGWDKQGQALKILRTFLEKCLNHVDSNRLSSVAFPAMGTGNLGYPRETVAKEMFDAVHNFGSNNPSTTISDVRFVLYDKDTETVKAFEREEKRQGGGSGRHGRQFGSNSQYQAPPKVRDFMDEGSESDEDEQDPLYSEVPVRSDSEDLSEEESNRSYSRGLYWPLSYRKHMLHRQEKLEAKTPLYAPYRNEVIDEDDFVSYQKKLETENQQWSPSYGMAYQGLANPNAIQARAPLQNPGMSPHEIQHARRALEMSYQRNKTISDRLKTREQRGKQERDPSNDVFATNQNPYSGRKHLFKRSESVPVMPKKAPQRPPLHKSSSSPRSFKIASDDWLEDRVMDTAMSIVKRNFPDIRGLQETCVASVMGQHGLKKQSGKFLQIINTQGNHWILLSNIGWDHHHVRVFDSCYRKLNADTRSCIVALVPASQSTIKVLMPAYQRQENKSDCGLFAVAAMFALALGKDPSKCYWDSRQMRSFLRDCLDNELCQMFPSSRTRVKQLREKEYDIEVCQSCCNFPSDNPMLRLCSNCQSGNSDTMFY
ncbi:protein mono-ADP-ribosyltransferase PARP14-like isoform X2 [Saccostrea cucullata]|uniref:protein mono-ADP-ribosyltransferase PARP14-like isoform X2 n=1 Tax=Saccostrea cuccullata TaxID=36930 RepID=UPI002ED5744E